MLSVLTVAVLGAAILLQVLTSSDNTLAILLAEVGKFILLPLTLLVALLSAVLFLLSGIFPTFENWHSAVSWLIAGAYGVSGWYYLGVSVVLWVVATIQFADKDKRTETTEEDQSPPLTDINGIGEDRATKLEEAGYTSVDDIRAANTSELSEVSGFWMELAVRIKNSVEQISDENRDTTESDTTHQDADEDSQDHHVSRHEIVSSEELADIDNEQLETLGAAGYTTVESLRTASLSEVAEIVGHSTAIEIRKQVGYVAVDSDNPDEDSDAEKDQQEEQKQDENTTTVKKEVPDLPSGKTEATSEVGGGQEQQTERREANSQSKSLPSDVKSIIASANTDPFADLVETEADLVQAHTEVVAFTTDAATQEEYDLAQETLDEIEQKLDQLPGLIDVLETARSHVSSSGPSDDTETEALEQAQDCYDEAIEMAKRAEFPTDCLEREREQIYEKLDRREATTTMSSSASDGETVPQHEELINELQRLDESTRGYPKTTELITEGQYTPQQYYDEFGSWDDALEVAGIDKEHRLIEEIKRVDEIVDGTPNTVDLNAHSVHNSGTYSDHFGSWDAALEAAGVARDQQNEQGGDDTSGSADVESEGTETSEADEPTRADYIEAIQQVAEASDRVLKSTDVGKQSQYSVNKIISTFGSWKQALEAANVDNEARLLQELRRVGDEVGHPPTTTEMNEHGHVSAAMYADYFESFTEARERAFSDEPIIQEHPDSQTEQADTMSDQSDDTRSEDYEINRDDPSPESEFESGLTSSEEDHGTDKSVGTIAQISDNARLDWPLAVKIIEIREDGGSRKQSTLRVEDIDGDRCQLHIWEGHDVTQTWQAGTWYVLEELRGKVWTINGQTHRLLSSTRDLRIDPIGSDKPSRQQFRTGSSSESESDASVDRDSHQELSADEDDSILGELMSEFDDLSKPGDS